MKALPFLLAAVFITGCDKMMSVDGPAAATPTPAPVAASPTPEPKHGDWLLKGYKNPLDTSKATPAPALNGKPTPAPKHGDWLLKNYKNPLDPPKR